MSTSAERAALIASLRALPDALEELVGGLSPEQLTTHYLAGEWTVAQNVHHLFDSHANSYIRCKLALTEDEPPFKPYNQDAWADLPDATDAEIGVSLGLLRGLHTRWARFWETLPAEAWGQVGRHPEYGTMSLDDILRSYVAHGEGHLDQITRTLAAQ
jgi:hypothetical protein